MTSYSAMFQNILIMQEFLHHMTAYLGFVESSLLDSCMERKTAEKLTCCLLPLPELSCLPADAGRGKLLSLGIKKLLLSLTGADVHRPLFFGGKKEMCRDAFRFLSVPVSGKDEEREQQSPSPAAPSQATSSRSWGASPVQPAWHELWVPSVGAGLCPVQHKRHLLRLRGPVLRRLSVLENVLCGWQSN